MIATDAMYVVNLQELHPLLLPGTAIKVAIEAVAQPAIWLKLSQPH